MANIFLLTFFFSFLKILEYVHKQIIMKRDFIKAGLIPLIRFIIIYSWIIAVKSFPFYGKLIF